MPRRALDSEERQGGTPLLRVKFFFTQTNSRGCNANGRALSGDGPGQGVEQRNRGGEDIVRLVPNEGSHWGAVTEVGSCGGPLMPVEALRVPTWALMGRIGMVALERASGGVKDSVQCSCTASAGSQTRCVLRVLGPT